MAAEVNGRRINEAIERGLGDHDGAGTFICECGRLGCTAKLQLSLDEYEHVRSGFNRFLVAPRHEVPDVDVVVEEHDGYSVTSKQGVGAVVAENTDPRGDDLDRG